MIPGNKMQSLHACNVSNNQSHKTYQNKKNDVFFKNIQTKEAVFSFIFS